MSFISSDNSVGIWMVMCIYSVFAMYAERHWKWSMKYANACTLCLLGGALLCTVGILPPTSPAYDPIHSYVAPLAIPMLLFSANLKQVAKQGGKMAIIFLVAAVGVTGGTIVASLLLRNHIPELHSVAAVITGSQTGGAVNVAAMRDVFDLSSTMFAVTYIADNIAFVLTTFVMLTLPTLHWVRKHYPCMYEVNTEASGSTDDGDTKLTAFDVMSAFTVAFAILFVTNIITSFVNGTNAPALIKQLFGQTYLVLTLITVLLATFFPKQMGKLKGGYDIGMLLLCFFFIASTVEADMKQMFEQGPWLFIFCGITFLIHVVVLLVFGKLFRFKIEEIVICSNASLGGPSTAAAVAAGKGWKELITPAVLVGVFGYIIGNYLGVFVGNLIFRMTGI